MEDEVLMEIQRQLGRIEAAVDAVKSDVAELKQKDTAQSQALEEAYAKAKARQDSIKDGLQHQIDFNKASITAIETRISAIEGMKEKALSKWWDRIVDKIVWVFIIGAMVVLLRWLNAPSEVLNQLPK
jgi:DNA repair ATPase RecN